MTAPELEESLASPAPPLLIQVLPEEVFAARRIPGSHSACVFEVSFPEQVAAITGDPGQAIVVYGAGGGSRDAIVAAEKLAVLGYTKIGIFEGGLEAWEKAGLPLEGNGESPGSPLLDGRYRIDINDSVIRWTGRNLFNHHSGTVALAGGEIVLKESEVTSARFEVAMDTIACEDIPDAAMNRLLIDHLRSDDFFDIAHHPVATFVATAVTPIPDAPGGGPTHLLLGEFTLRGITQAIEFPIQAATADGTRLTAQGTFDLDRTGFGSLYGSGRFFRFLGKHLVNDIIHLHLKIHADFAH